MKGGAFHGGNTGSNPIGHANNPNDVLESGLFAEGLKGFDKKKSRQQNYRLAIWPELTRDESLRHRWMHVDSRQIWPSLQRNRRRWRHETTQCWRFNHDLG